MPEVWLGSVLETLRNRLCLAGLIEMGLRGELAARFLLLTALNVITSPSWGARSHVSQEEILYSQL